MIAGKATLFVEKENTRSQVVKNFHSGAPVMPVKVAEVKTAKKNDVDSKSRMLGGTYGEAAGSRPSTMSRGSRPAGVRDAFQSSSIF
jgi:hypothetical protein